MSTGDKTGLYNRKFRKEDQDEDRNETDGIKIGQGWGQSLRRTSLKMEPELRPGLIQVTTT